MLSTFCYSQSYIDYNNFEEKVLGKKAFGEDQSNVVVIEFWAAFNDANSFVGSEKIKDISHYYRLDVSKFPVAKKDYRIRMTPTIIIFKDGIEYAKFKAGLDLYCPVSLGELQKQINEMQQESKF